MFNVNGQSISITKGDTATFTITFTGQDVPEDGTDVLVSLKKTKTSATAVWEKRLKIASGVVSVLLRTIDTNIDFGQYWWDVRILFSDGSVYTPMQPASFKVVEVIGDVE